MSDLISRQAAIDAYGDWYVEEGTAEGFIGRVKQLLDGLPSVDIVRCKECKWGSNKQTGVAVHCEWHGFPWNRDGFCSYGERRK